MDFFSQVLLFIVFSRYNKLRAIQDVLETPVTLKEPHSVRWLSLDQAVQAMHTSWSALVATLGEEAVNGNPAADGLVKKIETYNFVAYTCILYDLLPVFSTLSKVFQASDLNMEKCTTTLASVRATLQGMLDNRLALPTYSDLYNLPSTEEDKITFEGVTLKRTETMLTRCEDKKNLLVNDLLANLERRFPDDGMALLNQMYSILNPTTLRRVDVADLVAHGLDELKAVADKLESAQPPVDFNRQRAQQDFLMFKNHARSSPAEYTFAEFVVYLCEHHHDMYPDFALMAEYLSAIPLNSASCERGFSAQNLTKTKTRNRLTEQRLEQLMRISINGPHMANFDYTDAARNFRAVRNRRK